MSSQRCTKANSAVARRSRVWRDCSSIQAQTHTPVEVEGSDPAHLTSTGSLQPLDTDTRHAARTDGEPETDRVHSETRQQKGQRAAPPASSVWKHTVPSELASPSPSPPPPPPNHHPPFCFSTLPPFPPLPFSPGIRPSQRYKQRAILREWHGHREEYQGRRLKGSWRRGGCVTHYCSCPHPGQSSQWGGNTTQS